MAKVVKFPLKPLVFLLCLGPAIWLIYGLFAGQLGANPIEAILRSLGDWCLRFVLLGLAISTTRRLTGWTGVLRYRRMIGLFAFFYVFMHLSVYIAIDHFFDWSTIWKDIIKRPYITIGMTAFVLLIPLAVTSPKAMMRKLGGARWKKLHKLVYIIAPFGVIHFFLLVKADVREPLIYGAILAFLLGERLYRRFEKKQTSTRARHVSV